MTNNDLSGLTTWLQHILAMGPEGVISGNLLGPADNVFAASLDTFATGIAIWSELPWEGMPMPEPTTGWVVTNNDFRRTGWRGWYYDAQGNVLEPGCVTLAAASDYGWFSNVVTGNVVAETGLFPVGTGGAQQQVIEVPAGAYGNRIVGHAANRYAQLEAANPGIGQRIKESGVRSSG